MNAWGSKAWDGCLRARAINVLHSAVCVSQTIIIIIFVVVIFQLRQAAIIKRVLIGLAYIALSNHRPCKGAQMKGREGLLSFQVSSCVLDISSFAPTKKLWLATMRGTTLIPLCMRQSTERTWHQERGGDKRSFVLHSVLLMSSKMRKSRHLRKFQTW